jgi:hypothetical protein
MNESNEVVWNTTMPDGSPVIKLTEGMTDGIRDLVNLGESVREAEANTRDHGWELYRQHELGQQIHWDGCEHDVMLVCDGSKTGITTGRTLVWEFCRHCGEMNGKEHIPYYWTKIVEVKVRTIIHDNGTSETFETRPKMVRKVPSSYSLETGYGKRHVHTLKEARNIIVPILEARLREAEKHAVVYDEECSDEVDCNCKACAW